MKALASKKKNKLIALAFGMAMVLPTMADARPVVVGKGIPSDLDACSYGEVTGLNPNGDGFLAVRAAPSTKSKMLYKIHNGQKVWVCEHTAKGKWLGVIYTKKGTDCRLDRRGVYKGRCYQGWVSASYIRMLAG